MRKGISIGVAMLAAIVVSGALAAIPSANGVIHGCFKQFGGALRVIDADAGAECGSKEKPLAWSVQGPKGDPGTAGPAGPARAAGPARPDRAPRGRQVRPGPRPSRSPSRAGFGLPSG